MLQAQLLPELHPYLVPALSHLYRYDLSRHLSSHSPESRRRRSWRKRHGEGAVDAVRGFYALSLSPSPLTGLGFRFIGEETQGEKMAEVPFETSSSGGQSESEVN